MMTCSLFPVLFALCDQQAACLLSRLVGSRGDLMPDRRLAEETGANFFFPPL